MNEVFVCVHKILQLQSNYTETVKRLSERSPAFGTFNIGAVARRMNSVEM